MRTSAPSSLKPLVPRSDLSTRPSRQGGRRPYER
jgi:hypothetical protein